MPPPNIPQIDEEDFYEDDITVPQIDEEPAESSSSWMGPAAATAALAGAGALAIRNPAAVGKIARGVQDLRIASMLSGLAVPKSVLGNLGAVTAASIERGSMAPLRELVSTQTASDVLQALKSGTQSGNLGPPATALAKYNPFGRLMGAFDEATQKALVRGGLTPEEAAREVLQAPLPHRLQQALENPVAQYLIPFRRTPFNQLMEGMKTFEALAPGASTGQRAALGTALAGGFTTGAAAEDPKTIALATAAGGRYGLPVASAAMLGRYFRTGNKRAAAEAGQGLSPVSDYSLQEGVLGPVTTPLSKIVPRPAAVPAMEYIRSFFGVR